jgi:long-chain fatty acid transport protein
LRRRAQRPALSGIGACATLLGLWLTPLSAAASGNAIARFGAEHGTVNATNPTALYYNPGALGFAEGTQLFLDGQLALRSMTWTHAMGPGDVAEPTGFAGANYGEASALNVFGGPMAGATMRLGDFTLGAAAYAPFGGQVSFERNEKFASSMYPGAADGVARWHGISAQTMSIYATLGAAYRLGPISFGVTGNLIFTSLKLTRAQPVDIPGNPLEDEGRSKLDVSGTHGSFGAGVMLEALPEQLWLSASYQAQPGLGVMELDGTTEAQTRVPPVPGGGLTQEVTFRQALPDIWRVGARWRASEQLELRLAADFTRWSVLATQCVSMRDQSCLVTRSGAAAEDSGTLQNLRRNWKNTVGVRAGASYWASPALELFAGLGYETAATPDATLDPVLADANNVMIAAGARYEIVETWFLAASYTHLQFMNRDNTGKSQLADPAVDTTTRRVDGGGKYSQWVGILNANVLKTF